jgi:hypothetical protein
VTPILQGLVAIGVGVRLGLLLLSQVSLIIGCDTSHMGDVVLVVLGRVFLWILLQNLDDLTPASDSQHASLRFNGIALPSVTDTFARTSVVAPTRLFGRVALQPVFELFSRHVDCGIEVSTAHVRGAGIPT